MVLTIKKGDEDKSDHIIENEVLRSTYNEEDTTKKSEKGIVS